MKSVELCRILSLPGVDTSYLAGFCGSARVACSQQVKWSHWFLTPDSVVSRFVSSIYSFKQDFAIELTMLASFHSVFIRFTVTNTFFDRVSSSSWPKAYNLGMPHVHHLQVPAEPHFPGSIEERFMLKCMVKPGATIILDVPRTSGRDTKTMLPRWTEGDG